MNDAFSLLPRHQTSMRPGPPSGKSGPSSERSITAFFIRSAATRITDAQSSPGTPPRRTVFGSSGP